VTGSVRRADATEAELVRMIVGVDPSRDRAEPAADHVRGDTILALSGVAAADDRGGPGLRNVSLDLRAGEIVGLVGVSGNGQAELGDVVLGVRAPTAGTVRLGGVDVTSWPVERRLAAGLGVLPDDPMRMAAVGAMSVQENLALGDVRARGRAGWLGVDWGRARARAEWLTRTFGLAMPRLGTPIETLSGGNVQRIVFARELSRRPRALLVYHPTRGLDIAAVDVVHRALRQARDEGAGVVVVSEDIDELRTLCDRLIVMYHGEIVGEMSAASADLHEIGLLMTTGHPVEVETREAVPA
jgi:simple sugar transport system ATP-binding protein